MDKLQANHRAGGMHINRRESGEIIKCSYGLDNGLELSGVARLLLLSFASWWRPL
jgi:hypothetical protein